MANEEEVVKAVHAVNVANVQVVDTAKMSFTEQLTLIRNTNILIGIHGAGLMFIMFAAEEVCFLACGLVESSCLSPSPSFLSLTVICTGDSD
jgi:capsular polysaccharide biosynthesis protein